MKCKHFYIRVSRHHLESDENVLNEFLSRVEVVTVSSSLIHGGTNFWSILVFYKEPTEKKQKPEEEIILSPEQIQIYEQLKEWRSARAAEQQIPPYMVASNLTLKQIAVSQPKSLEDLAQVKGFGGKKTKKYGEQILDLLLDIEMSSEDDMEQSD